MVLGTKVSGASHLQVHVLSNILTTHQVGKNFILKQGNSKTSITSHLKQRKWKTLRPQLQDWDTLNKTNVNKRYEFFFHSKLVTAIVHLQCLRKACGQHVEFSSHCRLSTQNYRYNSIATQIPYGAGLESIPYTD